MNAQIQASGKGIQSVSNALNKERGDSDETTSRETEEGVGSGGENAATLHDNVEFLPIRHAIFRVVVMPKHPISELKFDA